MKSQNNDKKETESAGFDWFGKVEHVVESFVKGLAGGFAERVREKMHELILRIQKNVTGFFLIMIGLVFALIGIANFINDLVKISNGMGYAVVGLAVLIIGLVIIKK